MQGTENFSKIFPESNTLFILPPSLNDLEQRLINRGTETKTQLETRLNNAIIDMEKGLDLEDSNQLLGYRLINDEIGKTQSVFIKLHEAIYEPELGNI